MQKVNFDEVRPSQRHLTEEFQLQNDNGKWVLTLSRGECRSGGYDIELEEAYLEEGRLTCIINRYDPAPGSFVTMAITYPTRQYVLELAEEPKEVIFKEGE